MVSKAYWWMVFIGLIIIMFFWTAIITAQGIEHYQVIIDNNLFRPLGWKAPDITPKFTLLGTIVGDDFARAYFKNVRTSNIIIVSSGDWLGEQQIENITSNNVIMKGEIKNYASPRIQFLTGISAKTRRKISGKNNSSQQSTNNSSKTTENSSGRERQTVGEASRRRRGGGGQQWQETASRFQNATPEERQKMIEEFRSRRGRGGGRRRN